MSGPIVALFGAPRADTEAAEGFLRTVAAVVACGHPVRLIAFGEGAEALDGDQVSDEVDRYLEALLSFGVGAEVVDPPTLAAALTGAAGVLRLGPPGRAGAPALLRLGRDTSPEALASAGQILPAPRRP